MAASPLGFLQPALPRDNALSAEFDESLSRQAAFSTALTSVFRGKFCDLVLPNRKTTTFRKDQVIYDLGDAERTLLFIKDGFVRVGAITPGGQEVIYDVRKCGDLVGELCASEPVRPDRAVALEHTDAISVPFEEFMQLLLTKPELIAILVDVFCRSLKEAYAQRWKVCDPARGCEPLQHAVQSKAQRPGKERSDRVPEGYMSVCR